MPSVACSCPVAFAAVRGACGRASVHSSGANVKTTERTRGTRATPRGLIAPRALAWVIHEALCYKRKAPAISDRTRPSLDNVLFSTSYSLRAAFGPI